MTRGAPVGSIGTQRDWIRAPTRLAMIPYPAALGPKASRRWTGGSPASSAAPHRRRMTLVNSAPCLSSNVFTARSRSKTIRSVLVSTRVWRRSEIPVIRCAAVRLKSASGGFGCYFGTTPQFEIPTRPNRNIFRNSQNLFLIA